jgi:hypothetical protein
MAERDDPFNPAAGPRQQFDKRLGLCPRREIFEQIGQLAAP